MNKTNDLHKHINYGVLNRLNNVLSQITADRPGAHRLLFGDFNFPGVDWSNSSPLAVSNAETREYLEACLNFNPAELVTEPTRVVQVN